ncbi:MAG: putative photosynthetic complex assembly protein PuhE [Pseudomonadota bacterium]
MMLLLAALYTIALWWAATQSILWLVTRVPKAAANALALLLAIASAMLAVAAAHDGSVHAAFVAFTAGVGLWAAFEIAFLTGAILGVDRNGPPAKGGARRAWDAFLAIVYHEGALIGTLVILAVVTLGAVNSGALATFAALWLMRASAKLNLFLGVRNLCTEFLPDAAAHLARHFTKRSMNPAFPFCVLCASVASFVLLRAAFHDGSSPAEAASAMLVGTLVTLGVIEHWLMVTPLSALALFRPGRVRRATSLRGSLARPVDFAK